MLDVKRITEEAHSANIREVYWDSQGFRFYTKDDIHQTYVTTQTCSQEQATSLLVIESLILPYTKQLTSISITI